MRLDPRLAAYLDRRGIAVVGGDRRTLQCTRVHEGEEQHFRVEVIRKETLTRRRATDTLEVGVDAGAWRRIVEGASLLAVYVADRDVWCVAVPRQLPVRQHVGSGGGRRRTSGGGVVYWPIKAMRLIDDGGGTRPWVDPSEAVEAEAQGEQPTILDLLAVR